MMKLWIVYEAVPECPVVIRCVATKASIAKMALDDLLKDEPYYTPCLAEIEAEHIDRLIGVDLGFARRLPKMKTV